MENYKQTWILLKPLAMSVKSFHSFMLIFSPSQVYKATSASVVCI